MKIVSLLASPFSIIYSGILHIRHKLFDSGYLSSYQAPIASICIGNLSVGGTGKTPHIIFLAASLNKERPAILSRGYGRKSRGFIEVKVEDDAVKVGDEPLEIKTALPYVPVFVCEDRTSGIKNILSSYPETSVILLDDAFQHRKVKCSYNILLTTFQQPFIRDYVIPSGWLRDVRNQAKRAQQIFITKTPNNSYLSKKTLSTIEGYAPNAGIRHSRMVYKPTLTSLHKTESIPYGDLKGYQVILLTGIANPDYLANYLRSFTTIVKHINFPDHYLYKVSDILRIKQIFDSFASTKTIVVTSKKDAMRLQSFAVNADWKMLPVFVAEITVEIDEQEQLISEIKQHITQYNEQHVGRHLQ